MLPYCCRKLYHRTIQSPSALKVESIIIYQFLITVHPVQTHKPHKSKTLSVSIHHLQQSIWKVLVYVFKVSLGFLV